MSKKITIEETRKLFEQVGLTLLEDIARGVDYKYECVDSDGYKYKRSYHTCKHTLTYKKRYSVDVEHTFSTKNPYFYDNMMLYIKKTNEYGTILLTKKEDISNIDMPIMFKCGICGGEFTSTWHKYYSKDDKCCNRCYKIKRSRGEVNTNHIDSNKYHEIARKSGLCILNDSTIRSKDNVVVQDKNGYRGLISVTSLYNGCSFERFGKSNPYALDNLRIYAFLKDWDCTIYNQEYNGVKSPFIVQCSCGNDFKVDAYHFADGKYQCNECRMKQSAISAKVELWLNNNNILYEKEKTFDRCVNKRALPFDFYLTDFNACIEVDGIGHYRPVSFGGKKYREQAEKKYETVKENDEIKTKYCEDNNIPLLRVPFWVLEKDEHDVLLTDFINKFSLSDVTNPS